jgi:hypothetical protein
MTTKGPKISSWTKKAEVSRCATSDGARKNPLCHRDRVDCSDIGKRSEAQEIEENAGLSADRLAHQKHGLLLGSQEIRASAPRFQVDDVCIRQNTRHLRAALIEQELQRIGNSSHLAKSRGRSDGITAFAEQSY